MINRIIIRIKIFQIIYAFYQKGSSDSKLAENELLFSLQKSYDLYHYLLLLIPALVDTEQKRIDIRKHKYLATKEERNPNLRFINNRFAEQLSQNEQLLKFTNEKGRLWDEEQLFIKNLLDKIIESDIYKAYLESEDNYDSDREFWRKIFKTFICDNEDLSELLEDKSIYWNDELDIVGTFVLKTIKQFKEESKEKQALLPMFKDEGDRVYAVSLLRSALSNKEDYSRRITKHIKNWDVERIAITDLFIMQIALAEILTCPSIPTNVTLNEYIDIVKYYSTTKSAPFINGILDAVLEDLKTENLLFKT